MKFKKGLYEFETISGNKIHTFEVLTIQKHKKTNDIRVRGILDGGKEKYYYGKRDKDLDWIRIQQWKTNLLASDRI